MQRYQVVEYMGDNHTAGPKAKSDTAAILSRNGYQTSQFVPKFASFEKTPHSNKLVDKIARSLGNLETFIFLKRLSKRLGKDAVLFFQFPFSYIQLKYSVLLPLLKDMKQRGVAIQVLVHDLDGIRYASPEREQKDLEFLRLADRLIVHTEAMKQYFLSNGFTATKMSVLWVFDYLGNGKPMPRTLTKDVVFAGNLGKSEFLDKLPEGDVQFLLYGINPPDTDKLPENVHYKGVCSPEEILSKLEGSFGLVWDGPSIDACAGSMGEYLKINSPHKTALYVRSGLPVIVWNKSGIAPFIEKHRLGLTVSSLQDISQAIDAITPDIYQQMLENVHRIGQELSEGRFIARAIAFD